MGKISVKFDNKGFEELYKQLNEMEAYEVEAGYYGEDVHSEAKIPMSNLAWYQENGTEVNGKTHIPSRPFMSQAHSDIQGSVIGEKELFNIIFKDMPIKGQLTKMGKQMEEKITLAIELGTYVKNADVTVALKGSSKPLIETSEMKDNPKSKVINKERDE